MQLQRIRQYISAYQEWLSKNDAHQHLYYWESQAIWQQHWDLAAPNLRESYDKSLDNQTSRRMWHKEAYAPKKMLLAFLDIEQEFVRSMFQDLFHEEKTVDGRADRFVFYCDQLMAQYRRAKPLAIDTSHYHDDGYQMVSLYLTFEFPALYAPYHANTFIRLLQKLGAANIPPAGDFARHCKLMRTLQNFLLKEESLILLHQARLDPSKHYMNESLLLAYDFCQFVVFGQD